jgi:hypothetical protein
MSRGSQLRRFLFLTLSLALSLILAFWLHSLCYYPLGPLFSLDFFLLVPMALTIVVDEWWILILPPFLFWSIAWPTLFLPAPFTFSDERQLVAFIMYYTTASVISGAVGILLRKFASNLRHRPRARPTDLTESARPD